MLKREEMLVLVWIRKIASARMGAKDNLIILPSVNYYSCSLAGMELVTIT
jgi:hypothetical protein